MQPSVPATPGHKPAQPLPAAPLQIERPITPPPTQPQQQEQQISKTPVVHVNQQTTRSGQVVRLPQKYKDSKCDDTNLKKKTMNQLYHKMNLYVVRREKFL